MVSFKKLAAVGAGAVLAMGVASASASVIDFTKATTGTTGTVLGGTANWTMTANGILNNSQAFDGKTTPVGSPLSFETDGYGVGAKDDEITNSQKLKEVITLTFDKPTLIDAIYFLDLFVSRKDGSKEVGVATFDGLNSVFLTATDLANTGSGYVAATFAPILAKVISFTVLDTNDAYGYADGALAGVGIAPVPVPAAGLLMVGGLGGLAALRRRKKA